MAEADAEHRDLADQPAYCVDGADDRLGVAGAVREEHAVGAAGEHVSRGRRRRDHLDATPHADEVAQDGALDAEVVGDDAERRRRWPPTAYGRR